MGSILPDKPVAKVEFFENHTATWQTNAVAIGTTAGAVTALTTKTVAARAAFNAQQLLIDQTKAATAAFNAAVGAMAKAGTDILKQVKARAATDGAAVYALALVPAPVTPSPVPPPGRPTDFAVSLAEGGAVTLKWKCANPRGRGGTIYTIARRTGAGGPFVVIGASGTRQFVDETCPAGVPSVTYQVVAVRSTARGPEALFTVNFGVAGGAPTASVEAAPRLAA